MEHMLLHNRYTCRSLNLLMHPGAIDVHPDANLLAW